MSVSDQLLDLLTIRQLLLERIIAGENIAMNKQLDSIAQAITKALKGKELTEYQGKRLDKAVSELASMVKINEPDLAGIAASEASFVNGMFASVGIDTVIPPASAVTAIAQSAVMQGGTMGEWFGQLNETTRFNLSRTIKNGVSLGLTNAQIAKSIMGKGDKGSEPIAKARRDAMAITRTATQTVANDVRMASYMENADIIKAVQWVSTLDSRTSDICIARAGKTWTFPEFKPIGHSIPWGNGPPAHWACRSTSVPVTRSMAEITGKAADQIAPRTRASMDGQVAKSLTFDQFLKNKPPEFADEMLGKGRAELWRSGKITLNQLLDQRGNPLTLAQLQSRYGSVAAKAATKTATIAKTAAQELDDAIKSIKGFEYSSAYSELKTAHAAARDAYDKVSKDYRAVRYGSDEMEAMRPLLRDANTNMGLAADKFRVVANLEKQRMLRLLDLPQNLQSEAREMIRGSVSASVSSRVNEATAILSRLIHKDITPQVAVVTSRKKRAFYTDANRSIHINANTSLSTIVHEIVHDLEFAYPDISAKTKAFLRSRANGQSPQSLRRLTGNRGYGTEEVAYEDNWVKNGGAHYMGKVYPDNATELLTMGVERMINDPKSFADSDPEYFRFVLTILRRAD